MLHETNARSDNYAGLVFVINAFNDVLGIVGLALLVMQVFALADAAIRPTSSYVVAEKWTKQAWLIVLGLAVAVSMVLGVLNFIGLIGLVASIVYIVDVRPAVRAVGGRREY